MTTIKPRAKLTGRQTQCTSCGELFVEVNTFDYHRVGSFETRTTASTRRCMTVEEMTDNRLLQRDGGFWAISNRTPKTPRLTHQRKSSDPSKDVLRVQEGEASAGVL